jgi:hypothetical protein
MSDLKCYGSAGTQALEIIFEVRRKNNNEKITRRKISFPAYKNKFFFFSFSSLWTLCTFRSHNFLIFLFILNGFKSAIGAPPKVLQIILEL